MELTIIKQFRGPGAFCVHVTGTAVNTFPAHSKARGMKLLSNGRSTATSANGVSEASVVTEPHGNVLDAAERSNLVRVNGHVLFDAIDIEDWSHAIEDEREARSASVYDVNQA